MKNPRILLRKTKGFEREEGCNRGMGLVPRVQSLRLLPGPTLGAWHL